MYVNEPERKLKVVEETDVCVIGGSCTGVFAAVTAARLGARTALIEKQNCFGGVATAGCVNIWHSFHDEPGEKRIIAGLSDEVIERLVNRDAVTKTGHRVNAFVLNTEELKIELDELIRENRVSPYLHSFFAAPYLEEGKLKGVIVENKNGRQVIIAKRFIDATGDGYLSKSVGCESYVPESLQPPTTCCKIQGLESLGDWDWQRAVVDHGSEFGLEEDWGWGSAIPGLKDISLRADTHVFEIDTSLADQLTQSEMEGRRKIRAVMDIFRKYGPRGSSIGLVDLAATIGARETARIKGMYRLTGEDVLYGKRFDDAVANGSYRVDIHHSGTAGITFRYLDGTEHIIRTRGSKGEQSRWREETTVNPTFYQIPYRSLLQGKYSNLLLAGRMIDADKTAFSAVRVMVNMNQTGEAAGAAAYLSLNGNSTVQDVDPAVLRATLRKLGALVL